MKTVSPQIDNTEVVLIVDCAMLPDEVGDTCATARAPVLRQGSRAASPVVQFMVIFLGMGSQSERAVKRAHRRHACAAGLRSARG